MTDKPKRSIADRRTQEDRRETNTPISAEENKRTGNKRRSGVERREKTEYRT